MNKFLHYFWRDHALALLFYLALTIGLTYPLIFNFNTTLIGVDETRHNLWILWQLKQVIFGNESLYQTHLLYYPWGISLALHSSGPLQGFLALPFWLIGPIAVYNGAVFISFILTGYFMYLLARQTGFEVRLAIFAGTIYLVAPVHVIYLGIGHLGQMLLGTIPLTLLTIQLALNLKYHWRWIFLPGLVLLLTFLDAPWNFINAILALATWVTIIVIQAETIQRKYILQRALFMGGFVILLVAPLLFMGLRAAHDPTISSTRNLTSVNYQPDLIDFFLPKTITSQFIGPLFQPFLAPYKSSWGHETQVYVTLTALLLTILAIIKVRKAAMPWLIFTLIFFILSLGPSLKILGQTDFTDYPHLPIILPYAFLSSLPGLDVIRTPGRFMQIAFVGLSILAAFGLSECRKWLPLNYERYLVIGAIGLLLFETWPSPIGHEPLRPMPDFYTQIGQDNEIYGVFDLPIKPDIKDEFANSYVHYSAYYEMYQMVHKKGIASGYISRVYSEHPLFPHIISEQITDFPYQTTIQVNQQPANRYANLEYELASYNYRYVVFHKPQPEYQDYKKGSWGEKQSQRLIKELFGNKKPLVDDKLTTVYQVSPITDVTLLKPNLVIHGKEPWTESPTAFYLYSPTQQTACLEITIGAMQNPQQTNIYYQHKPLHLQSSRGFSVTTEAIVGQTTTIPLLLAPGRDTLTMTLSNDNSPLNVAIETINLQTKPRNTLPPDTHIMVNGTFQPKEFCGHNFPLQVFTPKNWPEPEPSGKRWIILPAELLIDSPMPKEVTVEIMPALPNDLNLTKPVTKTANFWLTYNGWTPPEPASIVLGQPFTTTFALKRGLNTLKFSLHSANTKSTQDEARFPVSQINLITNKPKP